ASALAMSMTMRITKIHTSNWTCTVGFFTARRIKVISATPVTPYVSKPSPLGPTESPALSPVRSAMTPGLRASSSLIWKTIFMRTEPDTVHHNHNGDKHPQDHQEFALRKEISFAGFVNQFGDVAHGLVNGQVFQARINRQTEAQAENANDDTEEQ